MTKIKVFKFTMTKLAKERIYFTSSCDIENTINNFLSTGINVIDIITNTITPFKHNNAGSDETCLIYTIIYTD